MDVQVLFDMLRLWPSAWANYRALGDVLTRQVSLSAPSITLMFNPGRVRSTAAKVDAQSVSRRPCFLCGANRPEEQRAIVWRDYDILANPFPIFSHHLTIVSRAHRPQALNGSITDMYSLARELYGFSVFFNGSMCGASAPDHMHFQAGDGLFSPSPLQLEVDNGEERLLFSIPDYGSVSVSEASGRLVYHMVANSEGGVAKLYLRLFAARWLRQEMMSVIARVREQGGEVVDFYIIPRRLFRPWQYSADGDERVLISPATVEVAGIFVLPRREDFDNMSEELARDIMSQVCFSNDSTLIPVSCNP